MHADLQTLQAKLIDFGLNPRDWIVETQDRIGNLFQINVRNQCENDLILQGWAMNETWLALSYQG